MVFENAKKLYLQIKVQLQRMQLKGIGNGSDRKRQRNFEGTKIERGQKGLNKEPPPEQTQL